MAALSGSRMVGMAADPPALCSIWTLFCDFIITLFLKLVMGGLLGFSRRLELSVTRGATLGVIPGPIPVLFLPRYHHTLEGKVIMARWGWQHYHLALESRAVMARWAWQHYHIAFGCKVVMPRRKWVHYLIAFESKVVMRPSPSGHCHLFVKSKVVMHPSPHGQYHFALEQQGGNGQMGMGALPPSSSEQGAGPARVHA